MKTLTIIQFKRIIRTGFFSTLLFVVVALAFASKGGGDKKKNISFKNDFVPIRTTNGFTLKNSLSFTGSHIVTTEKNTKAFSYNTIATYQKGNTVYVLPYKYKVNTVPFNNNAQKSNFQMLNLKINMHK
jgi:hypothetical protein